MGGLQNEEAEALHQATLFPPWASGKAQPSPGIPLLATVLSLGRSLRDKVPENKTGESLIASTFYLKALVAVDSEKEDPNGFFFLAGLEFSVSLSCRKFL